MNPLMLTAQSGKAKEMKRLLIANPNISETTEQGIQAIHFASYGSNSDCLKMLIEAGADVNAAIKHPTKENESILQTPAHIVASQGNYKALNLLFNSGAIMNKKDAIDRTPIEMAIISKNKPI
jgi:ankyrin repeat protein